MNKAGEIKVRAERRIGELLKAVPRERPQDQGARGREGGRGKKKPSGGTSPRVSNTPLQEACEQAAITPDMAKDCQKLAAIPEPLFETPLVTGSTAISSGGETWRRISSACCWGGGTTR